MRWSHKVLAALNPTPTLTPNPKANPNPNPNPNPSLTPTLALTLHPHPNPKQGIAASASTASETTPLRRPGDPPPPQTPWYAGSGRAAKKGKAAMVKPGLP
mgnify:CR=1 FL=1